MFFLPLEQIHLCDEDVPHAFVLGKGPKLGMKVSEALIAHRKSPATGPSSRGTPAGTPTDQEVAQFLSETNTRLERLATVCSGDQRSLRSSRSSLSSVNVNGEEDRLPVSSSSDPQRSRLSFLDYFWKR